MGKKRVAQDIVIGSVACLMVIASLIYMAYLTHKSFREAVISQTSHHLLTIAEATATGLEQYIGEHIRALATVTSNPAIQEKISNRIEEERDGDDVCPVEGFYHTYKEKLDTFSISDTNGTPVCICPSMETATGVDYRKQPDVAYVLRERKPYVCEAFNDDSKSSVVITSPVFHKQELIAPVPCNIYKFG